VTVTFRGVAKADRAMRRRTDVRQQARDRRGPRPTVRSDRGRRRPLRGLDPLCSRCRGDDREARRRRCKGEQSCTGQGAWQTVDAEADACPPGEQGTAGAPGAGRADRCGRRRPLPALPHSVSEACPARPARREVANARSSGGTPVQ